MTIPKNTPLFTPCANALPTHGALLSSKLDNNTLKKEWYAYVDSLYTHDKIPACKELIDYNIDAHTAPLSLNDMVFLCRVAMNIYQELCPTDFIGTRLRKIYEMSSKDEAVVNYLSTMLYIVGFQTNGLDFLFYNKEPDFILPFYKDNLEHVTELLHSQIFRSGALNEDTIYICNAVYSPEYIKHLPDMSDAILTKQLGCLLQIAPCLDAFVDMVGAHALKTIFSLTEIADMLEKRGLHTHKRDVEMPEFRDAKVILNTYFSTKFQSEYKQYSVLKTLDVPNTTIWSMIEKCHDIDSVEFEDIEI